MNGRFRREESKLAAELTGDPAASALAGREMALARRFSKGGTSESQTLARALVQDAKSLRYAKTGQLGSAGYSWLDGGRLRRADLGADDAPPRDALLARGEAFEFSGAILAQRAEQLRASLVPSDPDYAPRLSLADTALEMNTRASALFFGGRLHEAERMRAFAYGAVDLASRFVPGINWGRDVYEAVSGKDLFTGETLGDIARTTAVLGAVTLGIGEEVNGVAHAMEDVKVLEELRGLGLSGERTEEILETAKTIRSEGLVFDPHAVEEMLIDKFGPIDHSEVNDAIDRGTKWWNTYEQTIVSIERDVAPGEVPVAACVDFDRGVITTAYREEKTEAELAVATIDKKGRYIRLTQ